MNEQTQPQTIRELLEPIVGADALREAEARVYDLPAPDDTMGKYMCRDGYCALGIIAREMDPIANRVMRFPSPDDVVEYDQDGYEPWRAADEITRANDHGELATPGALTALLNTPIGGAP